MGTFDPDIGTFIAEAVAREGITLVLGDGADRVETGPDGRARAVVTASGARLPADLVVLGLGVRPNVALAQAAGIPLGASGGIAVDARMRTSVPGVWAAGDCVESVHRLSGQRVVVALGTHANKQGRVAGINLGGGYATFPGVIGTAVTKVCDLEVARTGLSEAEATAAGYCYVTASVDSTTRAGYFPGARPIRVKLTAEKRSGRLLGAQIAGREGAAKRIDVLATAIWNEMSVDEVLGARPVVRPAVRAGVGPGAHRRPQGVRGGRGRRAARRPRRQPRLRAPPPQTPTAGPRVRTGRRRARRR